MSEPPSLIIHTDGASRGNPGAAAYAFVIARPDAPDIEEADCLGSMTNNQAEYTALVRALERALELGPDHRLLVHSDSELMVKQMNGEYRVKNEELRGLYERAQQLTRRFRDVVFRHVRRGHNSRADALCNEALDGKRSRSTPAAEPSLRDEAVRCLREAGTPEPETAWEKVCALLRKRGVSLPEG
jgi:ribonuclease HI/probable phosphoglycerate mutase